MIPKLPHPWGFDPYPYEVLCDSGVTVSSSHDEILDVSLELQSAGKWSTAILRAWDELRQVDKRLAVDFFLYQPSFADLDQMIQHQMAAFLETVDPNAYP